VGPDPPHLELELTRDSTGARTLVSTSHNVCHDLQGAAIEEAKRTGMWMAHLGVLEYLEREAKHVLWQWNYLRKIEFYDGQWRFARLNHRDAWRLMNDIAYGMTDDEAKHLIPIGMTLTQVRMELLKPRRRPTMETLIEEQAALQRRLVEIDWEMEHIKVEPEKEEVLHG
jgi:hypothetical protein